MSTQESGGGSIAAQAAVSPLAQNDRLHRLRTSAGQLPLSPGVYLMLDASGSVIYVGKAKRLRNRVSSYFQPGARHNAKTRLMVSHTEQFDTIAVSSEFEALVLECSLIKRHQPHYNILLKDGKGYPFVRLGKGEDYPRFSVVYKPEKKDKAWFFGPYGGHGKSKQVIETVCDVLRLPTCTRQFPRDIGKERPCLRYHLRKCTGVCKGDLSPEAYAREIQKAVLLLRGKVPRLLAEMTTQMKCHATALEFEAAAALRDDIRTVETLARRQLVVGGGFADTDAVGLATTPTRIALAVLHFRDGDLIGKDTALFSAGDETEVLRSFLSQYFVARGVVPRWVLTSLPFEDAGLLEAYFREQGQKVTFSVPKSGKRHELLSLAVENAKTELEQISSKEEKIRADLIRLQTCLGLAAPPRRIETIDMSDTAGANRVGVISCFIDGKVRKKNLRTFKVKDETIHDDLHAMGEVLTRRFARAKSVGDDAQRDAGFAELPDLLLVDGGQTHAANARDVLQSFGLTIPVFGMVKDNRHRTRDLVSPDGDFLGISGDALLFGFVGRMQEETHNAAHAFHQKQRTKFKSKLDDIPGVGAARRDALLKRFGSIKKIAAASVEELTAVVPQSVAEAVFAALRGNAADS